MITIIDYGMGNLHSVYKAFKRVGADVKVSNELEVIKKSSGLVLPGVGHFKRGMENLINLNLVEVLNKKVVEDKTPILGICLGMQLLTNKSEEGSSKGLGWINAETVKFDSSKGIKVPHIGWNNLFIEKQNALLDNVLEDSEFYFVHSFYVANADSENILSTTEYGQKFISVVNKENIYGTQFHPEKSHEAGLKIIKNFTEVI